MLNGHGDDSYKFGREISADFSTNVWHGGEPNGLKEYLFENWQKINRYPEVIGESLSAQIAAHHRLAGDQILVSSGTTESIYLIAKLFASCKTTIVVPAFSEYEDACKMHNHQLGFLPWEGITSLPGMDSDLVFICNPNNPSGETFHQLATWIEQNPHSTFVVDEAFIDFTIDVSSLVDLVANLPNLIIMRSLTKTYAIPGLRLGYIAADLKWIDKLLKVKQPWTVNSMALAAGEFIFNHFNEVQLPLIKLLSDKNEFVETLSKNEVLRIHPSHTHFFLSETLVGNAAELKAFLIEKHAILIRDASNFRGLTTQHFRLATLSPDKNKLIINALEAWKNC